MPFQIRLKQERERLGLSQAEFAELGGVKRVSQHLYEQGERYPDVRYLESLLANNVDVRYLLFGRREQGIRDEAHLEFAPQLLREIYRVVDEFARDDMGAPLPLDERLRLFQFLCAALAGAAEQPDANELRSRLAGFAG